MKVWWFNVFFINSLFPNILTKLTTERENRNIEDVQKKDQSTLKFIF